jgi:hypothetical protein
MQDMKRLILILLAAWAVSFAAPAAAQISAGLRLGANLSDVAVRGYDQALKTNSLFGVAYGLAVEVGIGAKFAIQPELLYSQHGFTVEQTILFETLKEKVRFSYLQVPLLAKLKLGDETVKVDIFAGPHFGFGIGEVATESRFLGNTVEGRLSWEEINQRTDDFGFTFGLGLSFAAGPGALGLDIRYQLGRTNIIAEPIGTEVNENRNLQLGLSYLVRLSKGKAGDGN